MIRGRLSNGMFLFGIDAENVRRLKEDKPIVISLAELGGTADLMIMYGETLQEIADKIESATGEKLPQPIPINKARKTQ